VAVGREVFFLFLKRSEELYGGTQRVLSVYDLVWLGGRRKVKIVRFIPSTLIYLTSAQDLDGRKQPNGIGSQQAQGGEVQSPDNQKMPSKRRCPWAVPC